MEELLDLRTLLEQGRYPEALVLLGEMEEMSRDDKINKIGSFVDILLLYLIKQQLAGRTTRSWEVSIRNALRQIALVNKRRKTGGYYLADDELAEVLQERWPIAVRLAALEALEGQFSPDQVAEEVERDEVCRQALQMILDAQQQP